MGDTNTIMATTATNTDTDGNRENGNILPGCIPNSIPPPRANTGRAKDPVSPGFQSDIYGRAAVGPCRGDLIWVPMYAHRRNNRAIESSTGGIDPSAANQQCGLPRRHQLQKLRRVLARELGGLELCFLHTAREETHGGCCEYAWRTEVPGGMQHH